MSIKPEFKPTIAGHIPADWGADELVAISEKIMVGIASAATHAYRSKGVPMFRNQNIKAGQLDDADLLFIAPEYEATFRNKRLQGGDLLTARTGYPGTTAVVPGRYDQAQSFTTLITRPRQNQATSEFLCHYINSESGQRFFTQSQIGGAQKNVNVATMRLMPIPLPPPDEQRAIAKALSDVDALLGVLDRMLTKKRDLKQAAMQQLLTGQTRLPGFEGEWDEKPLGNLAKITAGGTPSRSNPNYWDGDIPWITTTQIEFGTIYEADQFITDEGLRNSAARLYPPGTLLMALYGQGKTRGKVGKLGIEATTNQACAAISLRSDINVDYVLHHLTNRYDEIRDMSNSGSQENLNSNIVRNIIVKLPGEDEQTAIAEVLSDMDAEIAALERRREKTQDLKQGMMQELLTGKTRII